MTYPFKNLIFEGGGAKGIAYVGAMEVLKIEGILESIRRVGGTSAGSINATLFAAGFTPSQTRKILFDMDLNEFKDDSWGVLRDMKRLKNKYGWHKGDAFREWMGDLLKKKTGSANITFKGLKEHSGVDLYMYSTNISTGFAEVFSTEHTPRTRVVDAVRRSMSIPLFFTAVRDDRDDVFVDGGVINNYPIKLFDREKYLISQNLIRIPRYYNDENTKLENTRPSSSKYIYNKETLGFRLDSETEIGIFRDGQEPKSVEINNFLDYTSQLIKSVMAVQDNQHLHEDDWHRTVYIDTLGASTFDFDMSDTMKRDLVNSGKKNTKFYLDWWKDTPDKNEVLNHPDCIR